MKTFDFEKIISQVGKDELRRFSVHIQRMELDRMKITIIEEYANAVWLQVVTEPNDCVVLKVETKERN